MEKWQYFSVLQSKNMSLLSRKKCFVIKILLSNVVLNTNGRTNSKLQLRERERERERESFNIFY